MSKNLLPRALIAFLAAALLAAPELLSPNNSGWADVGELPEPGGLVTPGDKTDEIRMKSESVLFSVRPNDGTFAQPEALYYAHVTADFALQSLSTKAVSKNLFFPLHLSYLPAYQDPANAEMRQAENVKVLVEGQEVQVTFAELGIPSLESVVAAVFPVEFAPGRETAIRVQYDVRAVNVPKASSLSFKYMMQTGSHWAGTIGSGKVIFEFWQPVDSKSAFNYVNDFFQTREGRLEWDFADLEPTPDHDITVTFEPTALETWAGRPSYVKDIQTGAPAARAISDSSLAYLLDTARTARGWIVEQPKDPGVAWLRFDLDRAHTVAGLRIRTGIPDGIWDEGRGVNDTFRRPKTVAIGLSDGLTQTVTLEDMPGDWQIVPLPNTPTSSIRLSFLDSYPGTGRADAFLGVGRIQLIGVDAGSAGEPGDCTGPNLLRNGDFEAGFDGRGVGLGWESFHTDGGATHGFHDDQWTPVVYEGLHSQLIEITTGDAAPAADRFAGIHQTVANLEPGAAYELSIAGMMREEAAHPDEDPYRYRVQWAYSSQGHQDWTRIADWQELPWDEIALRTEPVAFSTYTVRLVAPSQPLTLFIRVWKKWATTGRELDVNLDAMELRRCDPAPTR